MLAYIKGAPGRGFVYRKNSDKIIVMQEIEDIGSPHQAIAHMLRAILSLSEVRNGV